MLRAYTFTRYDNRLVTYEGASLKAAQTRAELYNGRVTEGRRARKCACESRYAGGAREAGFLVCGRGECAGLIY